MCRSQLVLVCLLAGRAAGAQVPTGYHLGARIVLPDSMVEVWNDGGFRLSIKRLGRTSEERELIETAERLYPNREKLLEVGRTSAGRAHLDSLASGVLPTSYRNSPRRPGVPENRWWLDAFDATWIPFAVTGGAIEYYAGRLRDLAAGRGQFSYPPGPKRDSGSFTYNATVRRASEPGVAFVVELQLRWEYTCGVLCGIEFSHTRVVSFDLAGNPIAITGDRKPLVVVS